MQIVWGSRAIYLSEVQGLTRGQLPEWLPQFVELLLEHPSQVILGIQIKEGKIRTNGSIALMQRRDGGYKYGRQLIEWSEIRQRETASAAYGLVVGALPKDNGVATKW